MPVTRDPERGSAMLVTLILISALIAGAAVLVSMSLAANRSSEVTRTSTSALYCAERGLALARPFIAANQDNWDAALANGAVEPAWLTSAFVHDLDGNGSPDVMVYLQDNIELAEAGAQDPADDTDLRVIVVSRCLRYPEMPKAVAELVEGTKPGTCYDAQEGGCGGNGNFNAPP